MYLMGGTAREGTDYTLSGISGQVTIPAGQASATVVLHAVADHLKENNESAAMTLVRGSGYKVGKRAKAAITIVNGP